MPVSLGLAAVNQAVKEGRAAQTLRVLGLPEVALRSMVAECASGYQAELSALLRAKAMGGEAFQTRNPVIHCCVALHFSQSNTAQFCACKTTG